MRNNITLFIHEALSMGYENKSINLNKTLNICDL